MVLFRFVLVLVLVLSDGNEKRERERGVHLSFAVNAGTSTGKNQTRFSHFASIGRVVCFFFLKKKKKDVTPGDWGEGERDICENYMNE